MAMDPDERFDTDVVHRHRLSNEGCLTRNGMGAAAGS